MPEEKTETMDKVYDSIASGMSNAEIIDYICPVVINNSTIWFTMRDLLKGIREAAEGK